MAEQDKQQLGDGQDNYGRAIDQLAKAARQTANAAAFAVRGSTKTGGAAAKAAAGTAAGGPWGALIVAAWSLRHTLYKLLVCACLLLLVLVVMLVSLPSVVTNEVFGLNGAVPAPDATMLSAYTSMAGLVSDAVQEGYDASMARVERLIREGGYDYALSVESLINLARGDMGYDACYVLAAYSASMQQRDTSGADLLAKLRAKKDEMFPVTFEEKEAEVPLENRENSSEDTDAPEDETEPATRTVRYLECTVHPFDTAVIDRCFGLDLAAPYDPFKITVGQAIQYMADALKLTLYGTTEVGPELIPENAELAGLVDQQGCSETRRQLVAAALSLVGRVPYFWGGKSAPGWNEEWNTPKLVTAPGSPTTGTLRPYGLDCSGYADWVYKTALGVSIQSSTWTQWDNSYEITAAELLPGDLGFLMEEDGNHVLIFVGYGEDGQRLWVHCTGGQGVVLNTPGYEGALTLRRPANVSY